MRFKRRGKGLIMRKMCGGGEGMRLERMGVCRVKNKGWGYMRCELREM